MDPDWWERKEGAFASAGVTDSAKDFRQFQWIGNRGLFGMSLCHPTAEDITTHYLWFN